MKIFLFWYAYGTGTRLFRCINHVAGVVFSVAHHRIKQGGRIDTDSAFQTNVVSWSIQTRTHS
jgi:hypothetical protein